MKIKKIIKSESGAAQMVEAAIIYPIVFLCMVFLIYVGLYLLQAATVSAYAQKIAMLAAREVAYPGYIDLVSNSRYSTAAVEGDFGDSGIDGVISLNIDPAQVKAKAYRYWSPDPLDDDSDKTKGAFRDILCEMVRQNSILGGGDVTADIDCQNVIITQYVNVTVEQKLLNFEVLSFFGIESPTVKAKAKAAVNDTDETVRTTDFIVVSAEGIAEKLGVDVDGMRESVDKAKQTLGLK